MESCRPGGSPEGGGFGKAGFAAVGNQNGTTVGSDTCTGGPTVSEDLEAPLTVDDVGWDTDFVPGLSCPAASPAGLFQVTAQDKGLVQSISVHASLLRQASDSTKAAVSYESWGLSVPGMAVSGGGTGTDSPASVLTEPEDFMNVQLRHRSCVGSGLASHCDTGTGAVADGDRIGGALTMKEAEALALRQAPGAAAPAFGMSGQSQSLASDSSALLDHCSRLVTPNNNASHYSTCVSEAFSMGLSDGSGEASMHPLWGARASGSFTEVLTEPLWGSQGRGTLDAAGRPGDSGIRGYTSSVLSGPGSSSAHLSEVSGAVPMDPFWVLQGSGTWEAAGRRGDSGVPGYGPSVLSGPESFLKCGLGRLSSDDSCRPSLHFASQDVGPASRGQVWDGMDGERNRKVGGHGKAEHHIGQVGVSGREQHRIGDVGGSVLPGVQPQPLEGSPMGMARPGTRPSLAGRLAAVLSNIQENKEREVGKEEEEDGVVALTEDDMEALQEMCRRRSGVSAGTSQGESVPTDATQSLGVPSGTKQGLSKQTGPTGSSAGADAVSSALRAGAGQKGRSAGGPATARAPEDVRSKAPDMRITEMSVNETSNGERESSPGGVHPTSLEEGSRETQGQLHSGPHLQQMPLQHQEGLQQFQQERWQQQGPQQVPQQQRSQQGQGLLKQLMSLTQEQQQMERRSQKRIILGKGRRPLAHHTLQPSLHVRGEPPGARAQGTKDPPGGGKAGSPVPHPLFLPTPGLPQAGLGMPVAQRKGGEQPEADAETAYVPGVAYRTRLQGASAKRALSPVASSVRPKLLRVLSPWEKHSFNPQYQKLVTAHLMRLATAYATGQLDHDQPWVVQLRRTAAPEGPVTQRLAHYFLQALGKRFESRGQSQGTGLKPILAPPPKQLFASKNESAKAGLKRGWGGFSETVFLCTFLPALLGHERVHIILFSNGPGPEWAALFKALAAQPSVTPRVRVTMVIPFDGPQLLPELQQGYVGLGERVRFSAAAAGLALAYTQAFVRPSDYHPSLVTVDPTEAMAVGEYLAIHSFPDDSVLRRNPRDACLSWIHDLKPLVFTVIGVDGNLNSHSYLERVGEVLRLTTAILENFDSTVHDLATSTDRPAAMSMEHLVMGQLMNCVSSEGLAQTMRAENMRQWQERLASMGFERVPLGPNVFTALEGASLHPRLSVLPVQGCASLRWDGSPLVFALTARSPGTT